MSLSEWLTTQQMSQAQFAARVGVTQYAVSKWCRGGQVAPARVRRVVEATGGEVTAHELCPAVFPVGFEFADLTLSVAGATEPASA